MKYRLTKDQLLEEVAHWNNYVHKKIHLIACGGTALTLQGIKNSTKDVDLIVPIESEYNYLLKVLKDLGYKQITASGWAKDKNFIFDFFKGKKIHTTELIDNPLDKNKHSLIKEFRYIYLGILNDYDLIVSKLFRGTNVDFDDCNMLIKAKADLIDISILKERFYETAKYDISEEKVKRNLKAFLGYMKGGNADGKRL